MRPKCLRWRMPRTLTSQAALDQALFKEVGGRPSRSRVTVRDDVQELLRDTSVLEVCTHLQAATQLCKALPALLPDCQRLCVQPSEALMREPAPDALKYLLSLVEACPKVKEVSMPKVVADALMPLMRDEASRLPNGVTLSATS